MSSVRGTATKTVIAKQDSHADRIIVPGVETPIAVKQVYFFLTPNFSYHFLIFGRDNKFWVEIGQIILK